MLYSYLVGGRNYTQHSTFERCSRCNQSGELCASEYLSLAGGHVAAMQDGGSSACSEVVQCFLEHCCKKWCCGVTRASLYCSHSSPTGRALPKLPPGRGVL